MKSNIEHPEHLEYKFDMNVVLRFWCNSDVQYEGLWF